MIKRIMIMEQWHVVCYAEVSLEVLTEVPEQFMTLFYLFVKTGKNRILASCFTVRCLLSLDQINGMQNEAR